MMDDTVYRQDVIDTIDSFSDAIDTDLHHFQRDTKIGHGEWMYANGMTFASTMLKVRAMNLSPAQPDKTCEYWDSESNFCALHRPSAQPTAQWIDCHYYIECSNCTLGFIKADIEPYLLHLQYCPRCGRKMIRKDGEGNG